MELFLTVVVVTQIYNCVKMNRTVHHPPIEFYCMILKNTLKKDMSTNIYRSFIYNLQKMEIQMSFKDSTDGYTGKSIQWNGI